jgi:gas vesicle protein
MATQLSKILLATSLGAVAGFLFAPAKGSDMREKLRGKVDDVSRETKDKLQDAKKSLRGMKKQSKDTLEEIDKSFEELKPETS